MEVSCEKLRGTVSIGPSSRVAKLSDSELYEEAESGDVLTVWARSRSTGWVITVRGVRIYATYKPIVEFEDYESSQLRLPLTLLDFRTTRKPLTRWIRKVYYPRHFPFQS